MPLSYAEVIAITYNASDMAIVLTPAQQSLVVQALSVFTDRINWSDWETYQDEIQAYVADSLNALLTETIPPPVDSMLNIDLFTINATPLAGAGTLAYNASTSLPFGYTIFTQNITLYGMEQPVWLRAGEYNYSGWCTQNSVAGNTEVALTDFSGVVDTIITSFSQVGTFGVRVNKTGSFTVPANGFYKIVAGNVSAVSGNHFCNWISHHIRQTS